MKNINSKNILVVGDIMLDKYIYGNVDRISPEAPVPVLKMNNEYNTLGGATNVCLNLLAANQKVGLISIIGKDKHSKEIKKILAQNRISTEDIVELNRKTTVKTRFMANNNQQLLRLDEEDSFDISKEESDVLLNRFNKVINKYDIVVLSDYKKGLLTEYFTKNIIAIANKNNKRVIVDVKDIDFKKYKNSFLLKPNKNELANLTKMSVSTVDDIIKASKHLLKLTKTKYVLTTCGKDGMVLVNSNDSYIIDGINKEVFDVTGAGDTAISYLATFIVNGLDIIDSARFANIASSIKVTKVGTSIVKLYEVIDETDKKNYENKIITKEQFNSFHRGDKKIVFTNGCFDIVHLGHIKLLKEAKKRGDILIVGLNSDASVKRLKGKDRPVNSEVDRAEFLSSLDFVDYVIVFDEDTPLRLIKYIKPNVLVKGGDYKIKDIVGSDFVKNNKGEVITIPLVNGKSTTNVIKEIKKRK